MKKLTNKKGFTLMEMIIVVAIIAILAVITIPTLTANTDSAKKAADAANLRSAKAAYQVLALEEKAPEDGQYYNTATGEFGTTKDVCGQCGSHTSNALKVVSGTVVWDNADEALQTACPDAE